MTSPLVQVKSDSGTALVNPAHVAAIVDCIDPQTGPVPGACVIVLAGGATIAMKLTKQTVERVLFPGLKLAA